MTDASTDGARMIAACTSGDEATARELLLETPSLRARFPRSHSRPCITPSAKATPALCNFCCTTAPMRA